MFGEAAPCCPLILASYVPLLDSMPMVVSSGGGVVPIIAMRVPVSVAAVVQLRHSQEAQAQHRMLRVHVVLAHTCRRQRRGIDGHHLGRRGPAVVPVLLVLVPVDGVDGRLAVVAVLSI